MVKKKSSPKHGGSKSKTHLASKSERTKTPKTKTVKIKHHHKKPYRKRHISSLAVFSVLGIVLMLLLVSYSTTVNSNIQNAKNYIRDAFGINTNNTDTEPSQTVKSTYGYQFAYNPDKFYASGIDAATGDLYIGSELSTVRAYKEVRVSPQWSEIANKSISLSIQYKNDDVIGDEQGNDLSALETKYVEEDMANVTSTITKQSTQEVSIGGHNFIHSTWQRRVNDDSEDSKLVSQFSTYIGVINGKPLLIVVNGGFGSDVTPINQFDSIINSLEFSQSSQANIVTTPVIAQKLEQSEKLINRLSFTAVANAETQQVSSSELNSAKYGPAVVKIYNVYCMDISVEGKPYLRDVCDASTGSGFFITSDGYIATNGHVAFSDPKDLVIWDAFLQYYAGNNLYFRYLAALSGLTQSELSAETDPDAQLQLAMDKFYTIDDSKFEATNSVSNLLVDLNEQQPEADELLKVTKNRQSYTEQDTIKHAKFVDSDFRYLDGVTAFRASDVAIIKIDGSNYPEVKLGTIDSVTQGANISILGYPSQAGNNGISDDKQSKVTLTSGKVSSLKNALGSDKRLIETDTTIGHGNSGGPVLSDGGLVIGLATYTSDGSGQGNGVFNYVRDIKDLKDLADKNSVNLSAEIGQTQSEWEKGLEYFYNARYSKSLKNFEKVKSLYPQHPRVAEFVATAEQRIKDGQDVKDFPIVIVAVAALVVIGGIAVSLVFIIRHKRTHNVYKAQVSTGNMQPVQPGAPAQNVSYNPADVKATNNPLVSSVTTSQTQQAMPQQSITPATPPTPQQQPPADMNNVQPGMTNQTVVPSESVQQPQVSNETVPGGVITPQQPQNSSSPTDNSVPPQV